MKTIKVGSVKIKVNDKGHAKERYEVKQWQSKPTAKDEYAGEYVGTGVYRERHIYSLPYFKKLKVFKAKNNSFDPATFRAYSYAWWRYVDRINGKIVFNDYRYSNCTSKHQSNMRSLLSELNIKVDLYIEAPKGLQDLDAAIEMYEGRIQDLIALIQNPNTRAAKNESRKREVKEYLKKIEAIKALKRTKRAPLGIAA